MVVKAGKGAHQEQVVSGRKASCWWVALGRAWAEVVRQVFKPDAMPQRALGRRLASVLFESVVVLVLVALRALAVLPLSILRPIGAGAGMVVYALARRRRHITLTNLRLCFPSWSASEHRRVARAHFRGYVSSFLEAFIVWFDSPQRLKQLVRLEGLEHLPAAQSGQAVIVLAPHFLGLDAGGMRFQLERHTGFMYSNQSSWVLTRMLELGRARFHDPVMLGRRDSVRQVVRLIQSGVPFHLSPDMDLGPSDSIFVPFFGVEAATVPTLARLVALTGARVVPLVTSITPDGYVACFQAPWDDFPVAYSGKAAVAKADLSAATRYMNAKIEAEIRQRPEQYLWSHRRFKTRPPGQAGLY